MIVTFNLTTQFMELSKKAHISIHSIFPQLFSVNFGSFEFTSGYCGESKFWVFRDKFEKIAAHKIVRHFRTEAR